MKVEDEEKIEYVSCGSCGEDFETYTSDSYSIKINGCCCHCLKQQEDLNYN